jgi:hypothetical protein
MVAPRVLLDFSFLSQLFRHEKKSTTAAGIFPIDVFYSHESKQAVDKSSQVRGD